MGNSKKVSRPLRTSDIARELNMTDRGVRKWITVGVGGKRLRARRAGSTGKWFVDRADLNAFLTTSESRSRDD